MTSPPRRNRKKRRLSPYLNCLQNARRPFQWMLNSCSNRPYPSPNYRQKANLRFHPRSGKTRNYNPPKITSTKQRISRRTVNEPPEFAFDVFCRML